MKKQELRTFTILYIVLLFFSTFASFVASGIFFTHNRKVLQLPPQRFSDGKRNLEFRIIRPQERGVFTYRATIPKRELLAVGTGDYQIMINRLNSQGYQVIFNRILIGSIGDFSGGRSNLWNSCNGFTIDGSLVKDENELIIRSYSEYCVGLSCTSIFIVDLKKVYPTFIWTLLAGETINAFCIGCILFSALTIFLLYLLSKRKNVSYIYFTLALMSISIYFLDYLRLDFLPVAYLFYKKIVMSALFLTPALLSIAVYKTFNYRYIKNIAIFTAAGALLIALISRNMVMYKYLYNYYSLIIIVNLAGWLFVLIPNARKSDIAKIFLVGNIPLIMVSLFNVGITFYGKDFFVNTPLLYISVFTLIPLILVFIDFNHMKRLIRIESNNRLKAQLKSITDAMTGFYNHSHLIHLLKHTHTPFSLAMLDLDDFKQINDTFGHIVGDKVIQHVAAKLRANLRNSDLICRYGGDEFLVILSNCPLDKAAQIIEKTIRAIENSPFSANGQAIPVSVSAGVRYIAEPDAPKKMIERVDQALYTAKKNGKNRVSAGPSDSFNRE
jgi:diguanylate cyclase (GGDEF)-like protein